MNGNTWMGIGFVVAGFCVAFAAEPPTKQIVEPADPHTRVRLGSVEQIAP